MTARAISLVAEGYATFGQIVGRHFHPHLVAGKDFDVMHTHLTGDVGCDFVTVFEFYTKHCVGKGFYYGAVLFDSGLFCHVWSVDMVVKRLVIGEMFFLNKSFAERFGHGFV